MDAAGTIDAWLLEILRCPITRSRLRLDAGWLVAEVGGIAYPIREGIPVLLVEQARLPDGMASLEEFRERFAVEKPG